MIVVDASALLGTLQVAQVIRRYAANGEIDSERGRAAFADLADFPFRRCGHQMAQGCRIARRAAA
jgi:hypothetical protein